MSGTAFTTSRDDGEWPGLGATNATLIAWLVFIGFGSAFLAFYYSHIHYFPELRWEESFSYLAAISVFGGGIAAVYGLLLFAPGWIWSEFLIFDSALVEQSSLCYVMSANGERIEPCSWSIARLLVLPFLGLMILLHLALFSGDSLLKIVDALVGVLAIAWYSLRSFLGELRDKDLGATTASLRSLLVKYSVSASIAATSSIASLFILAQTLEPYHHSWQLLTLCTIAVVVTNYLVAVQFRQEPRRALVTSIVAALTLLTCGEILALPGQSQSERIMSGFGVGETSLVSLDLSPEGVARLKANKLSPDNLHLLSRLGEEYLVADYFTGRRVALKKAMVNSWSSVESDKKQVSGYDASPWWESLLALLCWVLTGLIVLWMAWDVHRKWFDLRTAFRARPSRVVSHADAELGSGASVYVEVVERSFAVATESIET